MKNFLSTADHSPETLTRIVDLAIKIKSGISSGRPLTGRSVALVFFDPSLRTRASMQVGIHELGGNPVILEPGGSSWTIEHRDGVVMNGSKTEHIKEFVRVLGRYVAAIGVRTFAALDDWQTERTDPILNAFAKYSSVPIINLESAMHHPCQAMADMMTIKEKLGGGRKKVLLTWTSHPKPLPMAVPNSFALASAQFGHDLRIARPPGYDLDDALLEKINHYAEGNGSAVEITDDVEAAYEGVDVVYAKSWGSKNFYGDAAADIANRDGLTDRWMVDEAKMGRTNDAIFMHCLPVRRNVIVSDAVIDSPRSAVIDEAENRLHVQKAIMSHIFDKHQ